MESGTDLLTLYTQAVAKIKQRSVGYATTAIGTTLAP